MPPPTPRTAAALLIAAAALLPLPAQAQHFPPTTELERMLRYLVDDGEARGIVLGVLEADGSTRIVHQGDAGDGARPLGPGSLFEIGSLTKPFTAAVLAEMALRGEVDLDDPVEKHLPPEVRVPARGGMVITLRHLATHTSGLPRGPDNHPRADPLDPYAGYTVEMGMEFLARHQLRRAPGARFEYSNLGYGLLGYALSRAAGVPFPELVRTRVLEPLGMEHTGYAEGREGWEWPTRGHAAGEAVPYWSAPEVVQGAGGLHSSAEELLRFVRAQVRPAETELERAMRMTHEALVPLGSGGSGQALGWRVLTSPHRPTLITHSGFSGGYSAEVALAPETGTGIVLLVNTADFRTQLARSLVWTEPPPAEWGPVQVPREVLAAYAGAYRSGTGADRFYVRLEEEGYLTQQQQGRARTPLYPSSDSTFFVLGSPWSYTFRRDAEGQVTEMVMESDVRGGPEPLAPPMTARRTGDAVPEPRVVTAGATRSRGWGAAGWVVLAVLALGGLVAVGWVRARQRA